MHSLLFFSPCTLEALIVAPKTSALLVVFDFQLLTARLEQEKIPESFAAIYWCVFRIHEVWPRVDQRAEL